MIKIVVDKQVRRTHQPKCVTIRHIARSSILFDYTAVSVNISIISAHDSQHYNNLYRNINKPTNVIALEYPSSHKQYKMLIGEIFICDEVVIHEALEQFKTIQYHYAHMIVHGMLHLQGFDHQLEKDAEIMELHESTIMNGFDNLNY